MGREKKTKKKLLSDGPNRIYFIFFIMGNYFCMHNKSGLVCIVVVVVVRSLLLMIQWILKLKFIFLNIQKKHASIKLASSITKFCMMEQQQQQKILTF